VTYEARRTAWSIELLGLHEVAGGGDDGRAAAERAKAAARGSTPAAEDFDGGLWVDRPTWHARAACRGVGPAQFFPGRGDSLRPAKAFCEGCEVGYECLSYGLENGCEGVWGGFVLNWHTR
jgi:WhiB family redox-sensing transcriptional regulator